MHVIISSLDCGLWVLTNRPLNGNSQQIIAKQNPTRKLTTCKTEQGIAQSQPVSSAEIQCAVEQRPSPPKQSMQEVKPRLNRSLHDTGGSIPLDSQGHINFNSIDQGQWVWWD